MVSTMCHAENHVIGMLQESRGGERKSFHSDFDYGLSMPLFECLRSKNILSFHPRRHYRFPRRTSHVFVHTFARLSLLEPIIEQSVQDAMRSPIFTSMEMNPESLNPANVSLSAEDEPGTVPKVQLMDKAVNGRLRSVTDILLSSRLSWRYTAKLTFQQHGDKDRRYFQ